MPAVNKGKTAEKILGRVKGLRQVMQPGEEPLLHIPAIWDNGREQQSKMCEVIVTNQRLLGYYLVAFPRERLFLDTLSLPQITAVSLRHKSFEPLFRELFISDGQHKVYIRASRKQIEALYTMLRSVTQPDDMPTETEEGGVEGEAQERDDAPRSAPVYGRQEIRRQFDRSPLAIVLLLVGGLALEILGAGIWLFTQSLQAGAPLFVAGFISVITAILLRRGRR